MYDCKQDMIIVSYWSNIGGTGHSSNLDTARKESVEDMINRNDGERINMISILGEEHIISSELENELRKYK